MARVAFGAKDHQTVKAFLEAESYPGPSLIIAYSHCIAHGYDMAFGAEQQKLAVDSGVWPLYRFDPRRTGAEHPFLLDSGPPKTARREVSRQREPVPDPRGAREGRRARSRFGGAGRGGAPVPALRQPRRAARLRRRRNGHEGGGRPRMRIDLSTDYLGLKLAHPLMPGASPMVDDLDTVRRLEDAGASAIVMHSLFEEQIRQEEREARILESHAESHAEARSPTCRIRASSRSDPRSTWNRSRGSAARCRFR